MTVIAAKMTSRGVLVPRSLMATWGNIREVEIELQGDMVVIKPGPADTDEQLRSQIINKMEAAGLIEKLPWPHPPVISSDERARLARVLGSGKPLSDTIIEEREERAVNIVYLDSSAVVKRYVDEVGSGWIKSQIGSSDSTLFFTSHLTVVEVVSAFARRVREGSLTVDDFKLVEAAFRGDCLGDYQIMPPTTEIVDLACELVGRHPLRAYDATHLASALSVQDLLSREGLSPLILLSADDRLNSVAALEGLLTDNPNRHP